MTVRPKIASDVIYCVIRSFFMQASRECYTRDIVSKPNCLMKMSAPKKKQDSVAEELNNFPQEIVNGKYDNAAEILANYLKMSPQMLSVSSLISSIKM